MKALETRVPPPAVALAVALAMYALARYGAALPPTDYFRAVGVVLAAIGLLLIVTAFRAFSAKRTTINPLDVSAASSLVVSGPFRLTRNPMYLGMAAILVGLAFWLGGAAVWLGPAAFVGWITRLQIIPEERAMRAKFGAAYNDFCRRTRRWI
ncbi:MAG: methyltransferase family protein [Paracoccaceae bacterium]